MKFRVCALLLSAALVLWMGPAGVARADDGEEHDSGDRHESSSRSEGHGSGDHSGHGSEDHGSGGWDRDHGDSGSRAASAPSGAGSGSQSFRPGDDDGAGRDRRGRQAAHDSAQVAVSRGDVVPYKDVLKQLAQQGTGKVLQVQLTLGKVRSIYELKVEDEDGNISTVTVDAGTGYILSGGSN